jgi:hypothetical protein
MVGFLGRHHYTGRLPAQVLAMLIFVVGPASHYATPVNYRPGDGVAGR